MRTKTLFTLVITSLSLCLFSNVVENAAAAEAGTIKIIEGFVDDINFNEFTSSLAKSDHLIVGLRIQFVDGELLKVNAEKESLSAYLKGEPVEIYAPRGRTWDRLHGFDGFFIVKKGSSTHQGVSSILLKEVDEAQVLLSDASFEIVRLNGTSGAKSSPPPTGGISSIRAGAPLVSKPSRPVPAITSSDRSKKPTPAVPGTPNFGYSPESVREMRALGVSPLEMRAAEQSCGAACR